MWSGSEYLSSIIFDVVELLLLMREDNLAADLIISTKATEAGSMSWAVLSGIHHFVFLFK